MNKWCVLGIILLLTGTFLTEAFAGGSGLNVVVVVNQNSTNSVQLGNYYREQRQVPPQNFLRINWSGNNKEWTLTDFRNTLVNPLLAFLSTNRLTNQIDYVVLSMDIPYRVFSPGNGYNSTTSALFYGFKNDPNGTNFCELTSGSVNMYAGSEGIFRSTPPINANSNSFLVTMITADDLATAKMVVHQGTISDGTFPTQTVVLGKSGDTARNVRYEAFDNSIFNARLRGNYSIIRTNTANAFFSGLILGYENGAYGYGISPIPLFVPGAMADNLTSYGGQLFEDTAGQTKLIALFVAGASGSYGTVTEPCAFSEKFPDPQNYFYQSRGFSLGECYYQSVTNPYQGMVAGEPLAAPFASPALGTWVGLASNVVFAATTNLSFQFNAVDTAHPVQQVDLFLDGFWVQTLTNIAPQSGNVLNVSLNGFAASYTVPASATIKSVTTGLTAVLNGVAYQNNTKISATAHGDRIELKSTAAYTRTGPQIPVSAGSSNSSGALTTFIRASDANPTTFLDSIAQGIISYKISGSLVSGQLSLTVTKTNGTVVSVTANNPGSTITTLAQQLIDNVNTNASLQGTDGLTAGDLQTDSLGSAYFNLQAVGQGFAAAQIKAALTASSGLVVANGTTSTLTANLPDLQPRNHLYITAGTSNLTMTFPLNTTNYADGYHELAAVAYEGSHVHTQARATQNVIFRNTTLSATLTAQLTGTNSALEPALQFTVTANTNVAAIQLFSTGGLIGSVSNQSSAVFSINFTNLGFGTHPFYAIVTSGNGRQYRTATLNAGSTGVSYAGSTLTGVNYPFTAQFSGPPVMLVFPATAGRTYNILSTTNLLESFQVHATVIPTNSLGTWTETDPSPAQQFYRVSVSP